MSQSCSSTNSNGGGYCSVWSAMEITGAGTPYRGIRFKVNSAVGWKMMGLRHGTSSETDHYDTAITYGFAMTGSNMNGQVTLHYGGSYNQGQAVASYTTDTIFELKVYADRVEFIIDSSLVHTQSGTPSFPLHAQAALYEHLGDPSILDAEWIH